MHERSRIVQSAGGTSQRYLCNWFVQQDGAGLMHKFAHALWKYSISVTIMYISESMPDSRGMLLIMHKSTRIFTGVIQSQWRRLDAVFEPQVLM